jgi:hypothetical protein
METPEMLKIDKKSLDQLGDYALEIRAMLKEADAARDAYDAAMVEIVAALNEKRDAVYALIEEAQLEAINYFDERSEKWQESDRGSAYGDWRDSLGYLAGEVGEEVEVPEANSIEEPDWLGQIEQQDFAEFNE